MGKFQGGGFRGGDRGDRGGKPSFGGKPRFGGPRKERGDSEMFSAVCSKCKKSCEVPFKPSSDKPVYCKDCFSEMRGETDTRSERAPRRDFGDRPAYRSDTRSDRPAFKSAPVNDDTKKIMQDISTKLDKLINAVERMAEANKVSTQKEAVKESVAKAVASDKPKVKAVKKKK